MKLFNLIVKLITLIFPVGKEIYDEVKELVKNKKK